MHGTNISGSIFADQLTNFLIDVSGLKQPRFQISIYYKYATNWYKIVVLFYVYGFVYWYTYEEIVKCFVDTPGKRFHMNFLGLENGFMSIRISQLKYYSILVYQAKYSTAVVWKYLDTASIKENTKFHKTTLPHDMVLPKNMPTPMVKKWNFSLESTISNISLVWYH